MHQGPSVALQDVGSPVPMAGGAPEALGVLMWGGLGAGEQVVAAFPAGTQRAVLRLQAVREEDAGQYVCEALGEAGVTFDDTVLDVGCKSLLLLLELSPLLTLPAQLSLVAPQGSSCPQPLGFPAWGYPCSEKASQV